MQTMTTNQLLQLLALIELIIVTTQVTLRNKKSGQQTEPAAFSVLTHSEAQF